MATQAEIAAVAAQLLATWQARMTAWQAMTPAQQTASLALGQGAPDPDYPQSVNDLAREYLDELAASGAVPPTQVSQALATGNAAGVINAFNQQSANAVAVTYGGTPAPVSLDPNVKLVIPPKPADPLVTTEGASLPVGFVMLPGESINEAMSRRFRETYGTAPPTPPTPTSVQPPDNVMHGGSTGMRPAIAAGLVLALPEDTHAPGDATAGPAGQTGADLTPGVDDVTKQKQREQLIGVAVVGVLLLLVFWALSKKRRAA